MHLKGKYNSFKRFIKDQITIAKTKQNWFNSVLEVGNFEDLENYIDYLENEFKGITPQQSKVEPEYNKEIPVNPYPLIFKNGYAYQMFLELKELTVKNKTIVADYAFIFHKMKDKTIKAINSVITEPAFIKFLNENFGTDISGVKLSFRNPANKQQLYTTILNKYQKDILSEPKKVQ